MSFFSITCAIIVCALSSSCVEAEQCGAEEAEDVALLQRVRIASLDNGKKHQYRALFVVGTEPGQPLYADLVFKERLELQGFSVHLVKDSEATNQDCEAFDVMLVSATISGAALGTSVNNCSTPQLIWEVGLYQANAMAGPSHEDAWVASPYWNKYHQIAWRSTGYWPPAPTGSKIFITEDGARDPLAAGFGLGYAPIFSVDNYGQNWVNVNSLGRGAKVVGILPPEKTSRWNEKTHPKIRKAVLFYYEKGAELYAQHGEVAKKSPGLRIGFPPYNFIYGSDASCEELSGMPVCAACQASCLTASEWKKVDQNPMPLSCDGVRLLDAAIHVLKEEAKKCLPEKRAVPR